MAEELDDLATPELEVDEQVADTEVQDPPVVDEPFLPVNDRTVYKTKEEAIAGFNSAAQRIQELSSWEKQAKQWGLADPRQLDAVANELLQLRREKAEAAAQAGKRNTSDVKVDPADPKAKEAAQVREYMKNLGYVSKEDQEEALKELREAVAEMRNQGSQSRELSFQHQEADARDDVASYIAAAGLKDPSGTKGNVVGTLIKDWINSDEERIDEWSKGGRAAKTLVKTGFDLAMTALDWKPATAPGTKAAPAAAADYSVSKARAMQQNKKLPAQGTGRDDKGKFTPKQKGHINAALHEKAWELMQSE